jgi:hypothetical protein
VLGHSTVVDKAYKLNCLAPPQNAPVPVTFEVTAPLVTVVTLPEQTSVHAFGPVKDVIALVPKLQVLPP